MTYILLDTNIYLHCQAFDTLPLKEIAGATDEVAVLLPMQVLRELEEKKDDKRDSAINKRARTVCSKLGGILLEDKASPLQIVTCEMPPPSEFKSGFLMEVSDDVILMSAIHFLSSNLGNLVVVSRDVPMLLKAKQLGLPFVKMPDKFQLPSDQEDKEKQQLREELNRFKMRMPEPIVAFQDGSNLIRLKKIVAKEPIVDDAWNKEEREYCLIQEKASASLERFKELTLYVFNNGTAPTGDLTVRLDTSKLKTCRTSNEVVSITVPKRFRTDEENNNNLDEEERDEWEPKRHFCIFHRDDTIDNPTNYQFELDSITQGLNQVLCYIHVDHFEAESGSIDWEIYAQEFPKTVKGTLHVIVE